MAEVAALSLEVRSDQVKDATVALRELPKAASAAERAAEKWSRSTQEAARSTEDFSRRVKSTIASLEFERQQLARSASERARYAALRRAGVAELSAEGQAISASVRALQAQQAALGQTSIATRAFASAWQQVRGLFVAFSLVSVISSLVQFGKASLDAVANFGELSDQMGITVQGLQALQLAAVQNNVKFEQLETGIAKFTQKIGEAANGDKAMIESLDRLGVKILDAQGKLRPTETLISEVAAAILSIEDPAKRASASVEFFSRSGAKFQPMLQAMARGFTDMGEEAKRAGTLIDAEVSAKLDRVGDAAAVVGLRLRKAFADGAVAILDFAEKYEEASRRNQQASKDGERAFRDWMDSTISAMAGVAAGVAEVFRGAAEQVIKFWIDAFNEILAGAEVLLNKLSSIKLPGMLGGKEVTLFQPFSLGQIPGGGASATDYIAGIDAEAKKAREAVEAYYRRQRAAQDGMGGAGFGGTEPSPGSVVIAAGTRNPVAIGAGGKAAENAAKKFADLTAELELARSAQDKMTEAARRGEVQFQEQEATLEAQKKLLDIFGKTLDETDPRLTKVRDLMLSIAQGKVAEAFNVATTELQKQNVILDAQIRLMNEAPEIQAREIALIKVKQEAEKAGTAVTQEMIDARQKAIEQNETLKNQAEELRKAQELWTAPLKSALESIQQTAADAFEAMLESGKISFESLKDTFTKVLRRMAAEFLALATIRPVMSVLVNAISPSLAQSMGLAGGGGISGGLGGGLGGGGLSLPSWLGGGSISGWLGSPIFGSAAGPAAGMAPTGASGLTGGGFFGNLTWGQGLGALAGAGMGIYQLLSGNGSTASTIGGISSILGAGLSLIPGVGPILGPAVGLLGNLIPGLFGQQQPTITNQTYGQLRYSSSGWFTNGGAWGPSANSSDTERSLAGLGASISAVFDLLGGVTDPQKVWGLSAQSKNVSGPGWSSDSLSTFLVDPSGNQQLWRMNESNMFDTGSAQVAYRSILEGATGEISENMRKAVIQTGQTMGGTSLQAIAETVTEILAFDEAIKGLGKTVTTAEDAVTKIDQSFAGMYATAEKYGLSTADVDAAKQRARLGVATDFGKSLSRELLGMTDPQAAALADLEDWRTGVIENNKWLLENVEGALDQINEIEKLYGLKRAQIVEQAATAALDSLKSALDRMLYGDLSGAAPVDVLAGTKATYMADLAKAFTGDAEAAARLNTSAADYMQAAQAVYGTSTTAYQQLRRQTIIDVASAYRYNGGQFGNIPAAYDVIMGNSLGGLAPAAMNNNSPALSATNGWLGSAWSNSTNAWLAANANNPALSELAAGIAERINAAISAPTASNTNALSTVSMQLGEMTSALQASEDRDDEIVALMGQTLTKMTLVLAKIA